MHPGIDAAGAEALIITYSAGGASQGAARFIVFHCADFYGSQPYYESIDLIDAFHPQTILAWGMNDALLPVPNGAPLRRIPVHA